MAFVEMDDAPRISWRDHFHEVEVYVTARRVAELHGYESCHHYLLLPPAGLACAFPLPSINATTAAGERRDAGMGNDTVVRVATVDMKNNSRGRLQPSPQLASRYRESQRT
jgi:hypothetical protein